MKTNNIPTHTCSVTTLSVGQMETNCYLIKDTLSGETLIVDPGDDGDYIAEKVQQTGKPIGIVGTHGHFDHVLAANYLEMIFSIPFMINTLDTFLLKRMKETAKKYLGYEVMELPPKQIVHIKEGDVIFIGTSNFTIFSLPGHTPGGIAIYNKENGILFSGDILFEGGSIGAYNHSYSDKHFLDNSVKRLQSLPENTIVYPGHGDFFTIESVVHKHIV